MSKDYLIVKDEFMNNYIEMMESIESLNEVWEKEFDFSIPAILNTLEFNFLLVLIAESLEDIKDAAFITIGSVFAARALEMELVEKKRTLNSMELELNEMDERAKDYLSNVLKLTSTIENQCQGLITEEQTKIFNEKTKELKAMITDKVKKEVEEGFYEQMGTNIPQ